MTLLAAGPLDRRAWTTRAELTNAIFEWIEAFHDPSRTPPSATCRQSITRPFT